MFAAIGADLEELIRPKVQGERVNTHVHTAVREPTLDFEAMRRLVTGQDRVLIPADVQSEPSVNSTRFRKG